MPTCCEARQPSVFLAKPIYYAHFSWSSQNALNANIHPHSQPQVAVIYRTSPRTQAMLLRCSIADTNRKCLPLESCACAISVAAQLRKHLWVCDRYLIAAWAAIFFMSSDC